MPTPTSVLCLLITAGTLLGQEPEQAQYRREGGRFTNSPEAILSASSTAACAAGCSRMKAWFCGGFSHHPDGTCDLYRGNDQATCNPQETAPPLQVDPGSSEPRSYRRRQQSACPGEAIFEGA